ncbi:HAD family hydrolase [Larsenimonas suaedae]|uniref:HAD family phosphatase n=1 Tax=Larsenimonas suaedae TaxID=1851019 RepID=A0ABU1GU91_9GAMM|nr:HAD family phosphatase [Larsenimonas suaedae]MCM2972144.1 HAD family phosphatase [Larsenimonas suaedae]MDR5895062.1 HAD family phosphatase [Larsenimonas suaedae]
MTLKAILFDCDGTLVDSESAHRAVWNDVLAPYEVHIDEDEYKAHYSGNPVTTSVERLKQLHPALDVADEVLINEKTARTAECFRRSPLAMLEGVEATLARCEALGLRRALVTGSGHEEVDAILENLGHGQAFEVRVARQDVARSKPDPESYTRALDVMGLAPHEAIALEDTSHGVTSAVRAGVEVIAIPNAYSAAHDFSGAVFVAHDMTAALGWIEAHRLA